MRRSDSVCKDRYTVLERSFLWLWQTKIGGGILNKKYRKNIEKQKDIQEKIEELKLKQEMLKEEQEEMENIEVLKEYRSINISIDEFLEMMRNYKKEEKQEKRKLQEMTHIKNHNNMEGNHENQMEEE